MSLDALLSLRSALLLALGLPAPTGETDPAVESAGATFAEEQQVVPDTGAGLCSAEIAQDACSDPGIDPASCTASEQCNARPYGKCVQGFGMIGAYCKCEYACAQDSDCGPFHHCVCAEEVRGHWEHSVCVPAECANDGQCESGQCDLSLHYTGCKHKAMYACRTAEDECADDSDCVGGTCAFDDIDGAWTCQYISCIVGRPLVIEGAVRVADAAPGDDWLIAIDVGPDHAGRLGEYWVEVAALEHASVASFARFTLELLAVGAPPQLVADTQRAALDEVEHAQLAWSLASAYLGRPVGPGPLRVDDVTPARSLEQMVASLVEEGCVGETLGAAEAGVMAEAAGPTVLGAALRKLAGDEGRHAALAWRTLQWLVARHGEPVRVAALAAVARVETPQPTDEANRTGLLSEAQRARLRRDTMGRVIHPILSAVLGAAA